MARNFYRIFTENIPVMGDSKTFGIPEAKGLILWRYHFACAERVTRSACNNPGCRPGKQLVRPSKMTTLHEKRGMLVFVCLEVV